MLIIRSLYIVAELEKVFFLVGPRVLLPSINFTSYYCHYLLSFFPGKLKKNVLHFNPKNYFHRDGFKWLYKMIFVCVCVCSTFHSVRCWKWYEKRGCRWSIYNINLFTTFEEKFSILLLPRLPAVLVFFVSHSTCISLNANIFATHNKVAPVRCASLKILLFIFRKKYFFFGKILLFKSSWRVFSLARGVELICN